jgi:hypothetical protein
LLPCAYSLAFAATHTACDWSRFCRSVLAGVWPEIGRRLASCLVRICVVQSCLALVLASLIDGVSCLSISWWPPILCTPVRVFTLSRTLCIYAACAILEPARSFLFFCYVACFLGWNRETCVFSLPRKVMIDSSNQ